MNVLPIVFALAVLAALLHVYIWYLESIAWTTPTARKVFGTSPAEAEATKFLAYNQGFYNLFLAVLIVAGLIAYAVDAPVVGLTLVIAGCGSMLAAALVLGLSSPAHRPAALRQGALPAAALVAAVAHLAG